MSTLEFFLVAVFQGATGPATPNISNGFENNTCTISVHSSDHSFLHMQLRRSRCTRLTPGISLTWTATLTNFFNIERCVNEILQRGRFLLSKVWSSALFLAWNETLIALTDFLNADCRVNKILRRARLLPKVWMPTLFHIEALSFGNQKVLGQRYHTVSIFGQLFKFLERSPPC